MPQSLSLADRLLAPATNLMGRLRFNQKAMLIGAAFTLTCGVLAGLVVTRSLGEISDARTARSATVGLDMLHDAPLALQVPRHQSPRPLGPARPSPWGARASWPTTPPPPTRASPMPRRARTRR